MSSQNIAPFGSWKSPITSDLIVAESIGLGGVVYDNEDIYWLEGRPSEGGRSVLVRRTGEGTVKDVTPQPYNVRTRVHEYGGGAFLVANGTVYFSNFADQRIYKQSPNAEPVPLTAEAKRCYAELLLDQQRDAYGSVCDLRAIGICEDSENLVDAEPQNYIASIDLSTGQVTPLVSGCDFYVSPRLSPDGKTLAWVEWNHPNMPWDNTRLCTGTVNEDGTIGDVQVIAGGEGEAVCHPLWSPDGQLYFVSDRNNWWNLYRFTAEGEVEALYEMEAEFGSPHWVFGLSLYDFISAETIVCTYTQNGQWYLATLDLNTKTLNTLDVEYTDIGSIHAQGENIVFLGGSPTTPTSVVQMNLKTGKQEVLKQATNLDIDTGYLSVPEPIAFPTTGDKTAYAWFYPPQNKDYTAPDNTLPPLVVKSHGGPTAATSPRFNLKVQYWTSRGFGFVDVNYGGSTGYGREYRQRLYKNWGIVDVDDCANVAQYLAKVGKVDGNRLAITGGSAGGYTTLAALTFRDVFHAGASHYGVSDLEALAKETHKFESRYLDTLVGKYPQEKEVYKARSPIYHTEQLSCPVIFFQGLEDKVVPPNQAEKMVEAIKEKGLPVAYVPFEGEQHGFRRAENIKRALDGEFYFYSQMFGFTPADTIEPVEIFNL